MALRHSNSTPFTVNVCQPVIIDLTNDSSDSNSSRASSPIIFHPDSSTDYDSVSNSDSDTVYESPSDEDEVVSLYYSQKHVMDERENRFEIPTYHSKTIINHGFSPLTEFVDYDSPAPKYESSFTESSYLPAHTARLFWVKVAPSRWVKMSAFVPDTEHWTEFFHVQSDAKYFPKTLQHELIGLSTVLQVRRLCDLRFLFLNYLMSSDNFADFDFMIDRTTFDKIEFNIYNMPFILRHLMEPNPVQGLSEGLDRPFCLSCGEPNMRFLPGTRRPSIIFDVDNDWRSRISHDVRHVLCEPCKNRKPYEIRSFSMDKGERLQIVAAIDGRKEKVVQRGTRRLKVPVEPELWLKSDYVCCVTGLPRKIWPWDEEITVYCPYGVKLELVLVYPQKWTLSPAHCLSEAFIKSYVRNYFPTGRNYELQEHSLLIKEHGNGSQTAVNVSARRYRTSMNFLLIAPGGLIIRDTWQLRSFGVDSSDIDFGSNLYGEIRWKELPIGNHMRHFILRRFVHDGDMNRYDCFELTPPGRYFRESSLAFRKGIALYWLMAFAGVNPYAMFEVRPYDFLRPEDFCFSFFYRRK